MYGGLFMNTITIDNNTYNSIVRYAQQNNISVSEAVVIGLNSFLEKFKEKVSTKEKYYISPEVKVWRLVLNVLKICQKTTEKSM